MFEGREFTYEDSGFVTGWNKEYLRYLYGGLVNAQNKFGDEIDIYTCYAKLGSGNSVDKSEFSFLSLQI